MPPSGGCSISLTCRCLVWFCSSPHIDPAYSFACI
jgi:hypothetical protein